ncbi:hypothetical protein M885DRAFT_509741 [Pelagophyceae sp. CCMP2097]|nr:hypothetical protein M885DRAFT_509741 [Pelagophyceae sp. CCMP2097]
MGMDGSLGLMGPDGGGGGAGGPPRRGAPALAPLGAAARGAAGVPIRRVRRKPPADASDLAGAEARTAERAAAPPAAAPPAADERSAPELSAATESPRRPRRERFSRSGDSEKFSRSGHGLCAALAGDGTAAAPQPRGHALSPPRAAAGPADAAEEADRRPQQRTPPERLTPPEGALEAPRRFPASGSPRLPARGREATDKLPRLDARAGRRNAPSAVDPAPAAAARDDGAGRRAGLSRRRTTAPRREQTSPSAPAAPGAAAALLTFAAASALGSSRAVAAEVGCTADEARDVVLRLFNATWALPAEDAAGDGREGVRVGGALSDAQVRRLAAAGRPLGGADGTPSGAPAPSATDAAGTEGRRGSRATDQGDGRGGHRRTETGDGPPAGPAPPPPRATTAVVPASHSLRWSRHRKLAHAGFRWLRLHKKQSRQAIAPSDVAAPAANTQGKQIAA